MTVTMLQPGQTVADYSWSRPLLQGLKAVNYSGVIRYIGPIDWYEDKDIGEKCVSKEEYNKLLANGLTVALVFQTTADRASDGSNAGMIDAANAITFRNRLGHPPEAPIFFAVDYDASPIEVAPYFNAISGMFQGTSNPTGYGIYGGVRIAEAGLAPWIWQTEAWSYGRIAAPTHMIQRIGAVVSGTDHNDILQPIPFAGKATANVIPATNTKGKPNMQVLVQLLNDQIILTDGFKARVLFDDGSEFAFWQSQGLPQMKVVDQWVDAMYRQLTTRS